MHGALAMCRLRPHVLDTCPDVVVWYFALECDFEGNVLLRRILLHGCHHFGAEEPPPQLLVYGRNESAV